MKKSTILRNLIAILFWLLLAVPSVNAADFQQGLKAFQSGDFKTALQVWRSLAEQGDASAQLILGIMYAKGEGVAKDNTQALYWYRKAAEQGSAKRSLILD